MSGPSLQRLAVVSTVFHLTFFLAVFFAAKHSGRFEMPAPYVVNLVGSDARPEGKAEGKSTTQAVEQKETRSQAVAKETKRAQEKTKRAAKEQEKRVSDQIAALEAKKKLQKLAELRNIISLKGSGDGKPASTSKGVEGKSGGQRVDEYYGKVTKAIWQNWIFPETSDKNLEAIISIRIMKDGYMQVTKIEKSSGNGLFDRSALRAIAKASPVTPPPYEMEIGVRFYP
jgi:colicin import membrane protein